MLRYVRIASILFLFLIASACEQKPYINFATAFGWGGYLDTDIQLSDFVNGDHTIMARFMPQYPFAYAGPILAGSTGNNYLIGMGNFFAGNAPNVFVSIWGTQASYREPTVLVPNALQPGFWQHIAIVRTGNTILVYLNGYHICADRDIYNFCDLTIPSGGIYGTTLRLGRGVIGLPINGRDSQYYGLIDDVAIFKRALSEDEIKAIYNTPTLTGNEKDLYAGLTFDDLTPSGGTLPPQLSHAISFQSVSTAKLSHVPAYKVAVSEKRNDSFDAQMFPPPIQQTALQLPFPSNETWKVIQGFDDPNGSHNDYAAFSYDLARQDQSANGQLFNAAAAGTVTEILQTDGCRPNPSDTTAPNNIMIRMAPSEIAGYLHLQSNSSDVKVNDSVRAGDKLALTSDSGANCGAYHLHFGVSDLPQSQQGQLVTFPVAFSNYQASDDDGRDWYDVDVGVPQNGQLLRSRATTTQRLVVTPFLTPPTSFTSTPIAPVGISFFADQTQLTRGQCTMVHWQVTNASQVFLDNAAVAASGQKQECPEQTITHMLRVVTLANQTDERTLTIQVNSPTSTRPASQPTQTRTPTPTVRFIITIPILFPTNTPTSTPIIR